MRTSNLKKHDRRHVSLTLTLLVLIGMALVGSEPGAIYSFRFSADLVGARQSRRCHQLNGQRSTAGDLAGRPEPILHF